MTTPVTRRVQRVEDALAQALNRGDFEIITYDGQRYLQPIMRGHVVGGDVDILSLPRLSLFDVARDLERALS
ncbi:MAG: hypothetical protein VYB05_01595 [Pseudomonadota bacterium]|nr:hypothetical protein [Pseudomonadota bacterium]